MRLKIILPNLLIVLAVGIAGWLYIQTYYSNFFDDQSRNTLERDRNLFVAVKQLGAVNFLRTAMARSRHAEIEAVFAPATAEELAAVRSGGANPETPANDDELLLILRRRAHSECQAFRAFLGQAEGGGRTPEIIAITDGNGVVISRDVDPNAEPVGVDFSKQYSSVRRALQGNAVHDLWYWNNFLLDVAIAPIHNNQGTVVGALLVGFDISSGEAERDRGMFGADVVYLLQENNQWRLHSSSIAAGARRQSLNQEIARQQPALQQSMQDQEGGGFLSFNVDAVEHIGLAGTLSSTDSSVPAGYLLLKSVNDVRAPAGRAVFVLFFSLLGVLLVGIVGFVLGNHFIKPVEEIEEGVLRIINGDVTHRFEVRSAEFGGLAYRVNQLVAVLTGEEEEAEEEPRREPPPEP
jgi:HAMP domain-containing protein